MNARTRAVFKRAAERKWDVHFPNSRYTRCHKVVRLVCRNRKRIGRQLRLKEMRRLQGISRQAGDWYYFKSGSRIKLAAP